MFDNLENDILQATLIKLGKLKDNVVLKPHQVNSVEKLLAQDGHALIAHATGTGKTLTSIAGVEALHNAGKANRALVVVPNGLRENYATNVKKFTDSKVNIYGPLNEKDTMNVNQKSNAMYNVVGYETFNRHKDKLMESIHPDTLIIDEAHRTRNNHTNTFDKLREASDEVRNVMALTGSVINNEPSDILPLMEVVFGDAKERRYRSNHKRMFNDYHVNNEESFGSRLWRAATMDDVRPPRHLIHQPDLSNFLDKRVDYVTHDTMQDYLPKKHEVTIHVPMSEKQTDLYHYALKELNDPAFVKKIQEDKPVDVKDIAGRYTKLIRARQVSTDPALLSESLKSVPVEERSPKIKKMMDDLQEHLDANPNNKVVVYSNLINSHLSSMQEALDNRHIGYSSFMGQGQMSHKERDKQLADFRKGKNRVILLSSAGGEGLDLPDATMLQMMEGHYNPEKIQQAEARIRRLGKEKQNDRTVEIRRYVSDPSTSGWRRMFSKGETGIDQWVYDIAERKDGLNTQFRKLL